MINYFNRQAKVEAVKQVQGEKVVSKYNQEKVQLAAALQYRAR